MPLPFATCVTAEYWQNFSAEANRAALGIENLNLSWPSTRG